MPICICIGISVYIYIDRSPSLPLSLDFLAGGLPKCLDAQKYRPRAFQWRVVRAYRGNHLDFQRRLIMHEFQRSLGYGQ